MVRAAAGLLGTALLMAPALGAEGETPSSPAVATTDSPGAAAPSPPVADPAPAPTGPQNEWRLALGGEFNPVSHGIFDLGFRRGSLNIELLTDTLEVRYAPELARGRWWAALRAEGGAAGLMISPWTDGSPDPSRGLMASYAGLEAGGLRYLPRGFYAGLGGAARLYTFGAFSEETTVAVPENTPYAAADVMLGYYSPVLQGWTRVGVELEGPQLSPHAHATLKWRQPIGSGLETRVSLNGGLAQQQGIITATRLGGLNPYVVPLAGAGWAEWWVEDYLAARVGMGYRQADRYDLEVFADGALFEPVSTDETALAPLSALGVGARAEVYFTRRLSLEGMFGYAPTIARGEGVARSSVYVLLSRRWGRFGKR